MLLIMLLFLPVLAKAALSYPSVINETAFIRTDGTTIIAGQRSKQPKLDIVESDYVWRYKVVDNSASAIDAVNLTVNLPATVSTNLVKPTILAVHGVGAAKYEIAGPSSVTFRALDISPEATITAIIELPGQTFVLNPWQKLMVRLTNLTFSQWLVVAIVGPVLMLAYGLVIVLLRLPDLLLSPVSNKVSRPPSALPPALVGVLLKGTVGVPELAATIIDLASRGYLEIIAKSEGQFAFGQRKKWQYDRSLQNYEQLILSQILSPNFITAGQSVQGQLNKHLYSEPISRAIDEIYADMIKLGYFRQNPKQSHLVIRFVGMCIFFLSIAGLALSLLLFADHPLIVIPWLVSLIASPLVLRLSTVVPPRTRAGREQAKAWLAFGQLLATKTQIPFIEQSALYETYLAYAVAMGIEVEWTGRFADMPFTIPDWFLSEDQLLVSYPQLAQVFFPILSFIGQKFSLARKPTSI